MVPYTVHRKERGTSAVSTAAVGIKQNVNVMHVPPGGMRFESTSNANRITYYPQLNMAFCKSVKNQTTCKCA